MAAGVTTTAADRRERDHGDPGVGERLQEVHAGTAPSSTIDSATVIAENSTVRPAVAMVRIKRLVPRRRRRPARRGTG